MDKDKDLYRKIEVEEEDKGTSLMEEPFNPSKIDIDTKSPTISLLITRLVADPPEIDLYPDFQRQDDLWEVQKQSQQFLKAISQGTGDKQRVNYRFSAIEKLLEGFKNA